ncbi:MAG: hypothetical protein K0R40_3087, partial [Burkholderiales bacterium]|jgi:hypothetical protein|nr:hypothetical protein [Burkholderiales bacterium]
VVAASKVAHSVAALGQAPCAAAPHGSSSRSHAFFISADDTGSAGRTRSGVPSPFGAPRIDGAAQRARYFHRT